MISDKEEGFCRYLVEWGCATTAYRKNYDTSRMKPATIHNNAYMLRNKPEVAARLSELRSQGEQEMRERVGRLIKQASMISDGNPNEIMQHQHNNCRHCWGLLNAWQWKNEAEHANAVAAATQRNADIEHRNTLVKEENRQKLEPMPTAEGGYGFVLDKRPSPDCPVCLGEGVHRVWIADTRTLGPNEQKLFAGIKQTRDGIEIKLQDQHGARDQLARILGAYKDPATVAVIMNQNNNGDANTFVVPASPQDAADFYSQFVKTGEVPAK